MDLCVFAGTGSHHASGLELEPACLGLCGAVLLMHQDLKRLLTDRRRLPADMEQLPTTSFQSVTA
jgi:hypothetical protein